MLIIELARTDNMQHSPPPYQIVDARVNRNPGRNFVFLIGYKL